MGRAQHSELQLGLAVAIPPASRQIEITRVNILANFLRSKEAGLLCLEFIAV